MNIALNPHVDLAKFANPPSKERKLTPGYIIYNKECIQSANPPKKEVNRHINPRNKWAIFHSYLKMAK